MTQDEMKKQIKEKLLTFVDEFTDPPDEIRDDDLLLELGILDSASVLDLVTWYEGQYGIDLREDEINTENLGTVEKMVELAQRKQRED